MLNIGYLNCDRIPGVCPLIDHDSRPMKALELLTLLHNPVCSKTKNLDFPS
jgi:hypothetical protein